MTAVGGGSAAGGGGASSGAASDAPLPEGFEKESSESAGFLPENRKIPMRNFKAHPDLCPTAADAADFWPWHAAAELAKR